MHVRLHAFWGLNFRYFEIEQSLPQDRETVVTSAVQQCLSPDSAGLVEDKLRLLACLYLSRRTLVVFIFLLSPFVFCVCRALSLGLSLSPSASLCLFVYLLF